MRLLRRVVFYLLVAVYLVVCPLTISYVLGYLFKPGAAHGIVKSGLIYLSSAPPDASVYIGKSRYTRRTPTVLHGLLPGEYPIRLALKGYRAWSRTVPVEAGKATVLERVLLLPNALKRDLLLAQPCEGLIPMPGTDLFLLVTGRRMQDLVVYDWKAQKSRWLLSRESPFRDLRVAAVTTVRDSHTLIVRVLSKAGDRFLWCEMKREEATCEDVTGLLPEAPQRVEWDPRERTRLVTQQQGHLSQVDLAQWVARPRWVEGVAGFGVFRKFVYLLTDDQRLERLDLDGRDRTVFPEEPVLAQALARVRTPVAIRPLSSDTVLFLGDDGALLTNHPPYWLVDSGVRDVALDARRERVVCWRADRLGLIDISRRRERELVDGRTGPLWVFRGGTDIQQVFWVYRDSHLLFRDGDRIFLLELETYGAPIVTELGQVKQHSSVVSAEESGLLYYLDRVNGQLTAAEILPRRGIIELPFPERREEEKPREVAAP